LPRKGACDVDGFDSLSELALDLRSTWNHATDPIWSRLDPVLWSLTNNPWVVLQTVSRDKVRETMADPAFRKNVDDLLHRRKSSALAPAWFQKAHPHDVLTSGVLPVSVHD
jgi:starch phosphorylase